MTETAIQTASVTDGALAWSTEQGASLVYPVGKQRVRLLLAADLLAAFADRLMSDTIRRLSAVIQGWETTRKGIASDLSLTDKEKGTRDAAVEREIEKLRKELDLVEAFDLDRYLNEVAKAALLENVEFGQLTSIVRKQIIERRGRPQSEVLISNWGSPEGAWIAVQVSPRDGDLLEAVHEYIDPPDLGRGKFLADRILPIPWFLRWVINNEALTAELGRSEVRAMKALAAWEGSMGPMLRSLHRDIVRGACALRGMSDALEVVQGARSSSARLRLRSDYIASFLPAFTDYRSMAEKLDQAREMELAGMVVVGMGGSGKTTFLRRCYDLLREEKENQALSEEIDPKSTAFVVGHLFRDITVPLLDSRKKLTLCWMDTAGSEDYRLLGQQLTVSVRELRRMFPGRPADYSLLFMWSYEPGHDLEKDAQGFEEVLSKFMDEVEDLGYFDLEPPKRTFLLLNKADVAARDRMAERFASEHERRFRSVMEKKGARGETLGFISTLSGHEKEISDRFLTMVFGLSDREWKSAYASVRAGINQGVIGNLLDQEDAKRFKREVYDQCSDGGQEEYLKATVAWIDLFLSSSDGGKRSTRALLRSLRSFLSGEMEGDAVT